ncbi:tRNA (adenosine(37)-N6)-threonylcarbamoyltransferase complex ATPase subunit type 1 TsaE [Pediococcus claussenii]|uniref:tRNA threonylcarbamoyladenosine biosynthesis protein TsaE n=1 Tax=Pediococcus claussenii (strain ATCC BAA-344 / DSM 14800 / JCM 18046 / KCTC 3811 / LMG 21948 / P06) TaxID=701521 RepID=G8PC46_PEDCP|nr:tRNA (adenosine(37)-N6)-threonylcarbamoyltransferase complex ATPase subunit type 1 TsaE [Pediococcus claussenii]AEV94865.1 hypothetical protein PECL_566 [Pediococcus claussenii ATCC BAA-344]ANZ70061.1 tRNA threonylcarbamoyladenosine biosynthesis protein TsaE [Pediococcus claussenii]ANZ71876.1 tRNA threonylcarbamoyladenosine biosynthesis protein TsaE [Pediococcus claussenii]KRN21043.1 hypothetical protein IV79_GL000269 [Pediococcus claussenii]
MEIVQLKNEDETLQFGEKLGKKLEADDVLILNGDLGAGKTTLTKGIAKGLGIKRYVKSPTYTIIHEYHDGRLPLYHMDAYRLEDGGADDLGLDDYFMGGGVTVIEWPQFVEDFLPDEYMIINIDRSSDNRQRFVTMESHGEHFAQIIKEMGNWNFE